MSKTRFYRTWGNMKSRCYHKKTNRFQSYGGKGIRVCDRWHKFIPFMEDMYESYQEHAKKHKENTQLDRIDSNGNYCPENCRWLTMEENIGHNLWLNNLSKEERERRTKSKRTNRKLKSLRRMRGDFISAIVNQEAVYKYFFEIHNLGIMQ